MAGVDRIGGLPQPFGEHDDDGVEEYEDVESEQGSEKVLVLQVSDTREHPVVDSLIDLVDRQLGVCETAQMQAASTLGPMEPAANS